MNKLQILTPRSIMVFGALSSTQAQKKKYQVEIVRDQWGVPHIFGKTDADVAYAAMSKGAKMHFNVRRATNRESVEQKSPPALCNSRKFSSVSVLLIQISLAPDCRVF